MSSLSSHNDLLQCVGNNNFFHHYRQKLNADNLFTNLRNAATSWGTQSKQYAEIQKMVHDLLQEMQIAGEKTDLAGVEQKQRQKSQLEGEADGLAVAFQKLDLELKEEEEERGERMVE